MRHSVFALAVASALTIGSAGALAPSAIAQQKPATQKPVVSEQQQLRDARAIEAPGARVAALEKFLADHPESQSAALAHQLLVRAMIEAKTPSAEIVEATDLALSRIESPTSKAMLQNIAAMELADRGEQLDKALDYAQKALAAVPAGNDLARVRATFRDTLGWVLVRRGDHAKAIEELTAVAEVMPTSQEVLFHLGMAYEKAGKNDLAIDTYVKSETIFLGKDESAKAPLRALYAKQHGSLAGLDAKLAAAREKSRNEVVFESRRFERPAPAWELKDLAGKAVKLADFKGKVVVLDFWGTWCPPCRAELPYFQALHEKYKDKGVVFLGMNWEQPGEPASRMKVVTDFMAKNSYTFPVVIDHDRVAVEAYNVRAFPTVFVVDGEGKIRYRNVGFEEGVDQILEAQLESLMR